MVMHREHGNLMPFFNSSWILINEPATNMCQWLVMLFVVCNELNKTISQIWDGSTLMLFFRRNFPLALMQQWQELEEIISSINFSDDCDSLI
jgi:hypothetical protein